MLIAAMDYSDLLSEYEYGDKTKAPVKDEAEQSAAY